MRPRNLERFLAAYRPTSPGERAGEVWADPFLMEADGYSELAAPFAGRSFEQGLYRLHDARTGPQALALIEDAFPEFEGRIRPFGQDWLGKQFGLDIASRTRKGCTVILFDPTTGEALDIPANFSAFHGKILIENQEAAVEIGLFREWSARNPAELPIPQGQCVGFRVPLFLGGQDSVENLELTDLDVYWSLSGQLRLATQELDEGTVIDEVHGSD